MDKITTQIVFFTFGCVVGTFVYRAIKDYIKYEKREKKGCRKNGYRKGENS